NERNPGIAENIQEGGKRRRIKRLAKKSLINENKKYWLDVGRSELEKALQLSKNEGLARNIILVVGDGMSLSTISAARVYKGQQEGRDGSSSMLSWEHFPHLGLSKTYNVNAMVPDSAATAFAMVSGVKTNYFTVGFDNTIIKGSPESQLNATKVDTILHWAQEAKMKTGLVTTARVTHATPAALYARTAHRDWECDRKMPELRPAKVRDITQQLVEDAPGKDIDVVLGGGRGSFTPAEYEEQLMLFSPSHQISFNQGISKFDCSRLDNKDLVEKWQKLNKNGGFVQTKSGLNNLNYTGVDKLLGLFSWSHMPYTDELTTGLDIPSLSEMTGAALDFLQNKSTDGYFLMVEGGRIDHAHHEGSAVRSLSETLELDRTVDLIMEKINLKDTLVLVTADHSHTMTMGGYPGREADITGVVKGDDGWIMKGMDGHPFPILGYANGPGFLNLRVKENQTKGNWESIERSNNLAEGDSAHYAYNQPSGIPLKTETHGGDDVGIWGIGPLTHLLHSTHEQTYIAHLMSLAGCIGPYKDTPRCTALHRT
ncbi:alkaline phosphatase, partial [Eurytemora carolleeae]|uniref:alkaline phosphatase n=1 Tax=Eurytemora carolleeae TaxID=1294199 RepID=UPI000C791805